MQDLNHLDCKIYVETEQKSAELASLLANVVNGIVEQAPGTVTIRAPLAEVELLRNDEADRQRETCDGIDGSQGWPGSRLGSWSGSSRLNEPRR